MPFEMVDWDQWINDPPLVLTDDWDKAKGLLERLLTNIKDYCFSPTDVGTNRDKHVVPVATAKSGGFLAGAIAWNQKVRRHADVAEEAIEELGNGEYYYIYILTGVPIGFMAMSDASSIHPDPYINYLVAHPGASNAGSILVEVAVQYSDAENHEGRLCLDSIETAVGFYERLGFKRSAPKSLSMSLDPSKSKHAWQRVGGEWRLVEYAKRKLLMVT